MDQYKEHPFNSDWTILETAFNLLDQKQKFEHIALCSYKGVNREAFEQAGWEDQRIKQVKNKLIELLVKDKKEGK